MLKIVHNWLNEKWDVTGLSLEKIRNRIIERHPEQSISISKLHRIFSDQNSKVSLEEVIMLAEAFDSDPNELLALIGGREYVASEKVDYKGAEALLHDFSLEKAQIRKEYEIRIEQSIKAREETQQAFNAITQKMEEQYRRNADYLTKLVEESKEYNANLTERAVRAEENAKAADERAEKAQARADALDRRRHQVFWCMIVIVFALLGLLFASFVLNIPSIGWGNL